jgi:ClpP class serine protease
VARTGAVGSIGVIAIHYSQAEAEAKAGVKYTAVYAGAHKNDFTTHEPLSDQARAVAQASVDKTYDLFVRTVARNRNMDAEKVRAQQAACFDGEDAVAAGLADGVMSVEEILAAHGQTNTSSKGEYHMEFEGIFTGLAGLLTDKEQKTAAVERLAKMGLVPEVDPAAAAEALEKARADGLKAGVEQERARSKSIVEKCVLAGCAKMAPGLVGEDVAVEAAETRIAEALHNADPGRGMDNSNGGGAAGGADYLIADAKRRAGDMN